MSYFFDLEDYDTPCRMYRDTILKSISNSLRNNKNQYYIDNGSLDGYTPSQDVLSLNNDGTISVYLNQNNITQEVDLGEYCCKTSIPNILEISQESFNLFLDVDTSLINWDAENQKCRWKETVDVCSLDSYKVVLNPVKNDGALFNIDGDSCELNVEFDYLFKFDCQTLADIINPHTEVNEEIKYLEYKLSNKEAECENLTYKINELKIQLDNTSYSMEGYFNEFTEPTSFYPINEEKWVPFGWNARGLPNYVRPIPFTPPQNFKRFCIIEENGGLTQLQNILGIVNFNKFIDGDPTSYTKYDLDAMITINNNLISNNQKPIITECDTPFGVKTNLVKQYNEYLAIQTNCQNEILELETEILNLKNNITSSECGSIIQALESLDVSMAIEVINNDGTLTSVYEQPILTQIGEGNLYTYLSEKKDDSGFYLCGNNGETWAEGCVPLKNDDNELNVYSCNIVKDSLLKSLLTESDLDTETFKTSLSKNIFASNWLNFKANISETTTLDKIKNKKIKLSLRVNNTCSNVCIYVDNIKLLKDCVDNEIRTVYVNKSPGFELERIVDNKKSWVRNTSLVTREFDIQNVNSGNIIRETEYDVNDERLVINTKEIDLNIDLANAIETDLQVYVKENPSLLESIPYYDCGCELECYSDVFEIISYSEAFDTGLITSFDVEDIFTKIRAVRDAWIKAWNELILSTASYLDIKNGVYHQNPSVYTMNVYNQTKTAWNKALYEFNIASGGAFIDGLTIEGSLSTLERKNFIKSYSDREELGQQMFNTKCGRILKLIGDNGYFYLVETPNKEFKFYMTNSAYAPIDKVWIDMSVLFEEDNPPHAPTCPSYDKKYYCKFLAGNNYTTWIQTLTHPYITNNNTSHNEWVNSVKDTFYVGWDEEKGKCMTNMFEQVVPKEASIFPPITSLYGWGIIADNISTSSGNVSPACAIDILLRNSGGTACNAYSIDWTWPNISTDISSIRSQYYSQVIKYNSIIKITEDKDVTVISVIDPNTNTVPDETSGYIPVKVTTTVTKGSINGEIVLKEEYVLNDVTSTCSLRQPQIGLNRLYIYIGLSDPNSTLHQTSCNIYSNGCTSDYGTLLSGSTSGLPYGSASSDGVNLNWTFDDDYYVHLDIINYNTNEVYQTTNNDFRLNDRNQFFKLPSSASTQTLDINAVLGSINSFKTTVLGEIQEDLDNALSECTIC